MAAIEALTRTFVAVPLETFTLVQATSTPSSHGFESCLCARYCLLTTVLLGPSLSSVFPLVMVLRQITYPLSSVLGLTPRPCLCGSLSHFQSWYTAVTSGQPSPRETLCSQPQPYKVRARHTLFAWMREALGGQGLAKHTQQRAMGCRLE